MSSSKKARRKRRLQQLSRHFDKKLARIAENNPTREKWLWFNVKREEPR